MEESLHLNTWNRAGIILTGFDLDVKEEDWVLLRVCLAIYIIDGSCHTLVVYWSPI